MSAHLSGMLLQIFFSNAYYLSIGQIWQQAAVLYECLCGFALVPHMFLSFLQNNLPFQWA